MSLWTDQSVEVELTDNGWVLKWQNEGREKLGHELSSNRKQRTRGLEVFTDRKKLMKRIEQLI